MRWTVLIALLLAGCVQIEADTPCGHVTFSASLTVLDAPEWACITPAGTAMVRAAKSDQVAAVEAGAKAFADGLASAAVKP